MYNRFTNLRFIIGLFFSIMAVLVLVGYLTSAETGKAISLYSGLAFLLFGLLMMYRPGVPDED
jgi:hypothetical protein